MVVNTELTEADNTTHAPGVTSITSDNYCHHHSTTDITLNEYTENTERTEHTEYTGYTDNRNTGKRVTGNWTKMVVNTDLTKEDNTTHTPEVKTGTTIRNVKDYSSVPEMNSKDNLNCRIQGPLNTEKEATRFPFHPFPFSCLLFPFFSYVFSPRFFLRITYCKDWHAGTSNWNNCEQRQTDIVTTEYTEYTEDTDNKDTGKSVTEHTGNWINCEQRQIDILTSIAMVVNTEQTEEDNTTHAPGVSSTTSVNYCHLYTIDITKRSSGFTTFKLDDSVAN